MTETGLIQGSDGVLSFYKNDWLTFVCFTDISIEIDGTELPIRTKGDGQWLKKTYKDLSYTLTLSGLLKFDEDNFTGWDLIDNQVNFVEVLFRCSFLDDQENVRSVQGTAMIKTSTVGISIGNLVKTDFSLSGNGLLMIFDGYVPCDSEIETITVTGQTAADGIAHINYTYSGAIYQIKYRIDDQGPYIYVLADITIDVPGLPIGSHSVEIIPVCANGYEGTGEIQTFSISQALTCGSIINTINVSGSPLQATNTFTGAATQMKYRIDGGSWIYTGINNPINVGGLNVGNHTIDEVPVCANGVEGVGASLPFTVASQPAQSVISFSATNSTTNGMQFLIYVNGVLSNPGNSGALTVPTGAMVKVSLGLNGTQGRTVQLIVEDTTTVTTLYNNTQFMNNSAMQFIFTANGDSYTVTGTITP